jgi:trimeric autotransporter adhesin
MRRASWARSASAVAVAAVVLGCPEATKVTGPSSIHSIAFMPDTATIAVGAMHTLTASALDGNGNQISGVTFFYSSQTSSIATVTSAGQVTGMAVGQVQIAASAQGISGYATVTVVPKPIGSVIVVPTSATLRVATTLQLSDTIKDISGAIVHVQPTWTSNFPDTVAVDQNGLVTALKLGSATITASYGGKSGSSTITVSVVPVKTVVITSAPPSLYIGQTTQLAAVAEDSAGNILTGRVIQWSSQNTSVATVDPAAGLVTAVSGGVAPVVAISEGVTSSPIQVTVTAAPANTVVLSPNVSQVHVGQVTTLTATVTNSQGQVIPSNVTFTSNFPNIASVQGAVTGPSAQIVAGPNPGTATITGTQTPATGTATFIVSLVGVDSVHVSAAQDTLTVGQPSETLTATPYDSNGNVLSGRPVAWSSSNRNVATVGATTGVVTPVAPGTAVIFATVSGVMGSLTMVVNSVPVGSVIVVPAVDTILPLGQIQLSDTVKDMNGNVLTGRPVAWSTTSGFATVNSSGLVTGVSPGSAPITATSGGVQGSNTTVVLAPVQTVIVAPATTTITTAQTAQFTDTLKDANGNVLTGRFYPVIWTTNDTAIHISPTGLVTPNGATDTATNVTVTATVNQPTGSRSGTATLTVKLVPVATVVVYPSPDTIYATSPFNTVQLNDSTKDANGNNLTNRPVTWAPTSGGVATVNNTGLVTATNTAAGSATITATSTDGPVGSGSVVVLGHTQTVNATFEAFLPVDTLSLSGSNPPYLHSVNADVQVLDSFGTDVTSSRAVTWMSSDPTTVSISSIGPARVNLVALPGGTSPSVTITVSTTNATSGIVSSTPVTIVLVP